LKLGSIEMDFRRALPVSIACLALGAFGVGCGGDEEESSSAGTPPPAGESAGPARKAVAVDMKDTQYVPAEVKVLKGGTITWSNSDGFAHTVTKEGGPGAEFDSGNIDGGGTFKQKFAAAGKVDYACTIHPTQTGTITVE